MSWDDRLCLGRAPDCEGYRGAPCDCFGPWTDTELQEAKQLLANALPSPPEPRVVETQWRCHICDRPLLVREGRVFTYGPVSERETDELIPCAHTTEPPAAGGDRGLG